MVTFVCENCDKTLKKKQCEGHIRGSCSPGALICIDCSVTFYGADYKQHISCISEQEKHWGDFAKVKKTKPIAKQPKFESNINLVQQCKHSKIQPKLDEKIDNQEQPQQQQWKGWKNQLKQIIRANGNQVEKKKLKKKIRKVYKKKFEQMNQAVEDVDSDFIDQKISKLKSVKETVIVSLQECE